MGLIDAPDPISWIEGIKDENQKRAAISVATSIAYSQYITFLYETGKALEGKWLVGALSAALVKMAASTYKILLLQDTEKLIYTAVPLELAEDKALLDSIHYEKEQHK